MTVVFLKENKKGKLVEDKARLKKFNKNIEKRDSKKVSKKKVKKVKVSKFRGFKKPKSINLQRGSTKDAFFGDASPRNSEDDFDKLEEDFESGKFF